jgi:hypothetical protein
MMTKACKVCKTSLLDVGSRMAESSTSLSARAEKNETLRHRPSLLLMLPELNTPLDFFKFPRVVE